MKQPPRKSEVAPGDAAALALDARGAGAGEGLVHAASPSWRGLSPKASAALGGTAHTARCRSLLGGGPSSPPRAAPCPAALEKAAADDGGGDDPGFEPVTLAFQDLHYHVPHPKHKGQELELLRGITGTFVPGRMAALVGGGMRDEGGLMRGTGS